MHLFLAWLFCALAQADTFVVVPDQTAIYQTPSEDAALLFYVPAGEKIRVVEEELDGFSKVRAKSLGKWRVGYVHDTDLVQSSNWGVGAGLQYSHMQQAGKAFQGGDDVKWQTSSYVSSSISPFLTAQFGRLDFWRLSLALHKTDYLFSATKNIFGTTAQDFTLQQSFISILLQRAWNPFGWRSLYIGIGGEVWKATSVKLATLGSEIPTTTQDRPTYFGAQAFVGFQHSLLKSISAYGEARFEMVANQTPAVFIIEGTAGLLYWP